MWLCKSEKGRLMAWVSCQCMYYWRSIYVYHLYKELHKLWLYIYRYCTIIMRQMRFFSLVYCFMLWNHLNWNNKLKKDTRKIWIWNLTLAVFSPSFLPLKLCFRTKWFLSVISVTSDAKNGSIPFCMAGIKAELLWQNLSMNLFDDKKHPFVHAWDIINQNLWAFFPVALTDK